MHLCIYSLPGFSFSLLKKACIMIQRYFPILLLSFSFLLNANDPQNIPLPIEEQRHQIDEAEQRTMDAVTFSTNIKPLSEEFCNHVIECAPPALKNKIQLLTNSQMKEQLLSSKMILHGPPGTGKTTLAQGILQKMGILFLVVDASALGNEYKNSASAGLARIAKLAVALKMAVIVEELDCLTKKNQNPNNEDNVPKALGLLMDALAKHKLLFIATTNNLKDIPKTVQSRLLSSMYEIPLKNQIEEHAKIIKVCLKSNKVDSAETITQASQLTVKEKCSVRDIKAIVAGARDVAKSKDANLPVITIEEFKRSLEKLKEDKKILKKKSGDGSWMEKARFAMSAVDLVLTIKNIFKGNASTYQGKNYTFTPNFRSVR